MEKRALLAAVLSILVLVIYQYFLSPRPPAPPPISPSSTVSEPRIEEIKELSRPSARWEEAEEVVVDTPLYRAVFITSGARLISFELKRYRTSVEEDAPPVDLVSSLALQESFLPAEVMVGGLEEARFAFYRPSVKALTVSEGEEQVLSFYWEGLQGKVEKRWVFHGGSYGIDLTVEAHPTKGALAGDVSLMWYGGSNGKQDQRSGFSGATAMIGREVLHERGEKLKVSKELKGEIHWIGYVDRYFLSAFIPVTKENGALRMNREYFNPGTHQTVVGVTSTSFGPSVGVEGALMQQWKLYLGPKGLRELGRFGFDLERAIDFGWFGFLAKPLALFMIWSHDHLIGNYGVIIILLTILIKILFAPLTHKSTQSMKKLQMLKPEMDRIKEKYGKDRMRLNQEMMDLYKRHRVNPFGGCLPILLQIPVFFALYRVLLESIELRHAPFVAWINDLSSPENLWSLSLFGWTIPIRLLPLIMGGTMWLQQRLSPTSLDPRQAQMMLFMPIIFTFLFWGFPSGLVIYWLVNNVLSITQQVATDRFIGRKSKGAE
ncbi:MAG: membrane protein insertase YidC [Deltaproteobacteria bacterium]|nr:membrane protein insertase YidC [Deltaproteobacteria bacterium]